MSNPIVIGDAVTVHVRAPSVPQWRTEPPANAPDVHVVPAPGPQGPPGVDADAAVAAHVVDPTPHPAYDDLPSLRLLFENGLI